VLADDIGPNRILWATDYPHADGFFPGAPALISGVCRVTPDLGTLTLLVEDFVLRNGLAFSPDESVLYINDTRRGHIRAFDLLPNGTLSEHTDRVFADLRGPEPGVPDGMKVDVGGQGLLRRRRRHLDHGSAGQKARPHRSRRPRHDQPCLRR